jgi:hypothetical protein
MRLRTRTWIVTLIAALAALAIFTAAAHANAPVSNDSSTPSTETSDCSSDSSCTPTTETCSSDCTPTTTTETTPECTVECAPPVEECVKDCTPVEECTQATGSCDNPPVDTPTTPSTAPGPTPGSGQDLPFTGPGDVILAIVIALLAGTGGLILLLGASGREAIENLSRRTMKSPSAFRVAYREHLKRQLEE